MSYNLQLPNIAGTTTQEQIRQINSFLYSTIEQLNYALGTIEKGSDSMVAKINDIDGIVNRHTLKFKHLEKRTDLDWNKLKYSSSVSESTNSSYGKAPANDGVYYRVENGNHVYVAFNCAFNFDISQIMVNSELIPEELRPARAVLAICPTDGRTAARVAVLPTGRVLIDWIQLLSSATDTTSHTVTWIDGYIDYFIIP